MDDQNNTTQDQNLPQDASPAVTDAEDSPVTEAPADTNPFAGLKADEDAQTTEIKAADSAEAATESESAEGNEAEIAANSEETPNNSDASESQKASTSEASETSEQSEISDSPSLSDSQKEGALSSEDDKPAIPVNPKARWYVVHTFAGHENKVATALRQRIEAEHLENLIFDILVPTQDKIEIKGGKKETVKEKIFPGYILIKMELTDLSWLAVRTTQGVTAFIGAGNKPTPISEAEVASIVKFTTQGASPTFKDVFMVDDTVKIVDGPFAEFIGKVDSVDKEKGRVRVLVSIFGRETPVELDFLQVQKL